MGVKQKREFLDWFLKTIPVSSREVLWILNYIANHDTILDYVQIVEQAKKTPRGIIITSSDFPNEQPIALYKEDLEFHDVNQIFHEIRMHSESQLFLEFQFPNSWKASPYLMVLEDNPFAPWNKEVEDSKEVDSFFAQEEQEAKKKMLAAQIDQALEAQDEELFVALSKELSELNQQRETQKR